MNGAYDRDRRAEGRGTRTRDGSGNYVTSNQKKGLCEQDQEERTGWKKNSTEGKDTSA